MSVPVCLSLCLCVCVCVCVWLSVHDHIFGTTRSVFSNFLCMLPTTVARFSSGGVVIRYVLPVLIMTSYLPAHKSRLLDVAAQLKRSAHAASDLAIKCAQ